MQRDIMVTPAEQVVPSNTSRHGLVVGIENYPHADLRLKCVRRDAEAMFELMTDPACGLFPPDNVSLLLDEQATAGAIKVALSKIAAGAKPEDTVWIYYAGHGAPDHRTGATCWITYDTNLEHIEASSLPNREIEYYLSQIRAERVVSFLDCCHASETVAGKRGTRDVARSPEELFVQFAGEGRVTVCSSDGKQKSVELRDKGHGAFTYFLVEGLRGAADAAGKADGVVDLAELWQ